MKAAENKRYVVVQTPRSGAWVHYLCGWCGPGDGASGGGWQAEHDDRRRLPVFLSDRGQALVFDEPTACQLVGQLDARYRGVVRTYAEELLHD